ncbi:hypothetical protein BV20DRAFT_963186 [Pilatotrama ljubarskyi]|nr:hypothetical protein BV20DRAFT_963186 [Pilatotrama ljubarskyi]
MSVANAVLVGLVFCCHVLCNLQFSAFADTLPCLRLRSPSCYPLPCMFPLCTLGLYL